MERRYGIYMLIIAALIASMLALASAADILVYSSSSKAAEKSGAGKQSSSKKNYRDGKGGCTIGPCPFSGSGCRCTYRSITKWWTKYCCTGGSPDCQTRHVWNYDCSAIGCC